MAAVLYYRTVADENNRPNAVARVIGVERKQKLKYRPYPMATINLEKLGSSRLRFSSARTMKIAEALY